MASVEERLAFLEGRVMEIDSIRTAIVHLEERMDRRFEQVESRFQAIDLRLDDMGRRLGGFEAKVDARFHSMDDKISRHFVWMVGIQVSMFIAMVTGFFTILAR